MKKMTDQEMHAIAEDLIPLYCDGLVQPESKAFIEKHLEHCPKCRKAVEEFTSDRQNESQDSVPVPGMGSALKKAARSRRRMTVFLVLCILGASLIGYLAASASRETVYPIFGYETSLQEEGNHVTLSVRAFPNSSFHPGPFSLKQKRKNGILEIEAIEDPQGSLQNDLEIDTNGLNEIRTGNIVLWQDGQIIPQAFSILHAVNPSDYSAEDYLQTQALLAASELGLTFEYAEAESRTQLGNEGKEWIFTFPGCRKNAAAAGDKSAIGQNSLDHLKKTALLMLGLPDGPESVAFEFPELDTTVSFSSSDLKTCQKDFAFPFSSLAEMTRFADTIGWTPYDYNTLQGQPVYACSVFDRPIQLVNETEETFSKIQWRLYDVNGNPTVFEGSSIQFAPGARLSIAGIPDPFENPDSEYELRVFGSTGNEIGSCSICVADSQVRIQNLDGKFHLTISS